MGHAFSPGFYQPGQTLAIPTTLLLRGKIYPTPDKPECIGKKKRAGLLAPRVFLQTISPVILLRHPGETGVFRHAPAATAWPGRVSPSAFHRV